jgi:hypothetical protein
MCWQSAHACTCPVCGVCGAQGDPDCYDVEGHGLEEPADWCAQREAQERQIAEFAKAEAAWLAQYYAEEHAYYEREEATR